MRMSDWSSDVCSSDLCVILFPNMQARDVQPICKDIIESLNSAALNIGKRFFQLKSAMGVIDIDKRMNAKEAISAASRACRSEERRVGKECVCACRYRGAPVH